MKALKLHPDHNKAENATQLFQELAKAHAVLSDPEKRAYYDKHGEVLEEDSRGFSDAREYWRSVFPKVTAKDIEEFKARYLGSPMEQEDVVKACKRYKGDMNCIVESVPYASSDTLERLYAMIGQLLNEGTLGKREVPLLPKNIKALKKSLAKRERQEAEEIEEQQSAMDMDSLTALIRKRQENREEQQDDFLASLAAKYTKQEKQKKKKPRKKKPKQPSKRKDQDSVASPKKKRK